MTRAKGAVFRWELVLLLWLAFFLNQGDRQIFGVTLPLIKAEFHLSDTQMGLIATTFSIVFGVLVPFAGWFGDFVRRDWVVVASLVIFSVGTLLTGTAAAFLPLLVYRGIATGVGEALYAPAANSLIGSYHDGTRGRALALHQSANYTGVVLGSFLAGWVADRFGWRWSFLTFGALGLAWALVIVVRTWGKVRRVSEGAAARDLALLPEAFLTLVRTPALLAQTIGFSGLVFVLAGYLTWTPSLMAERFHLSLAAAGFQSVVWHHVLAYAGLLVAGLIGDHFARRFPRIRVVMMAAAMLLCAPFLWMSAKADSLPALYLALGGFGFFRGLYDANLFAAIFERVEDRLRASVTGLIVAVAYVVGAFAPLIMGMLRHDYGLQTGLQVLAGAAALAGIVFIVIIALDRPRQVPA